MPHPEIRRHRTYAVGGLTAAQQYAAKVLAYSPIVYYKFNESSGTTVTNYGSIGSSDPVHRFSDIAGASLGPDGSSPAPTYVNPDGDTTNPYSATLSSGFTLANKSMSYWYRYDGDWGTDNDRYWMRWISPSNDSLQIYQPSVGNITHRWQGSATVSPTVSAATAGINNGNWHHCLLVFNVAGNALSVYYNGTLRGSATCADWIGTGLQSGNTAIAGREIVPAVPSLPGSFADFAIIPSVLDGTDATALATYGA